MVNDILIKKAVCGLLSRREPDIKPGLEIIQNAD